jgi:hypothetical protein
MKPIDETNDNLPTAGENGSISGRIPAEAIEPDNEGIVLAMISRATRTSDYSRERDMLKRLTFTEIEARQRFLLAKKRALFEAVGPILLEDKKRKGSK